MPKILIVDDDNDFRETFKNVLVGKGYDIETACNGNEALASYRKQAPDLVILDIFMPEKEGFETIFDFKKEFPDAKIIAISGGGTDSNADYLAIAKSMKNVKGIFHKPFRIEEMLLSIKEIIG